MIVRRIAVDGASNLVVVGKRSLVMTEGVGIVPFSTSAGYEVVDCSLETSRLVFLDCIPRPDIGCFPCVRSLASLMNVRPKEHPRVRAHLCNLALSLVFLFWSLAFAFPPWPTIV